MEEILHQAESFEKAYDWLGAAESYKKALNLLSEGDLSLKGDTNERLGYAFYRAAFQAEKNDEFRERMRQAVLSHEKAKEFYAKMTEPEKAGRMLRCDAMIALTGYWLSFEVPEKKRLVSECWTLAKDCLKAFEKAGDAHEYGKTFNRLSICVDFGFSFEWDFKARERMIVEAQEHGDRAIELLSSVGGSIELARAYVKTASFLETFGYYFVGSGGKEKYCERARDYVQKAREISEEAALIEVPSVLFGAGSGGYWGDGTNSAFSNLEKTLEYGRKTRDRYVIGCALDLLKYHTAWSSMTDDREEALEHLEKALQYIEEARRQYNPISFTSPFGGPLWLEAPYAHYYSSLAFYETDLSKRRGFLEKAMQVAPEDLKRSESSGYPQIISFAHAVCGMANAQLAKIVTDSDERRGLLEEALAQLNEYDRIERQVEPLSGWNLAEMRIMHATAKSGLADLTSDYETKTTMLEEAAAEMETSLKLCVKDAVVSERQGSLMPFGLVGFHQCWYGDLLNRLYKVSQNDSHLRKAIEAFDNAAESFQKVDLKSRIAECRWKAARVYDDLGDHLKAAGNFEAASSSYKGAAEKLLKLKDFYTDHARYMQAWGEIEKARHHHERQEYGSAKEHFEKTAELHKCLKHWNYLEPNYSAWAHLEDAEELSRMEHSEEAIKAFEQGAKLFTETKNSLQIQLSKIEDEDEKQMATDMIKTSDLRHGYCEARIAVEEAKVLDKKGNHYASSEKYGLAVEIFEKIGQGLESEREQKEFSFIVNLSKAWQKMTLAEAESSPATYSEASELFERAKGFSPNEETKMLILGHSRFCRALEAGTKFVDTADPAFHATAIQQLESAAKYYVKAEFQNASEYARATKLLFDAYLYMDTAGKESNLEKKTKLYVMAEKVLQTSAGSYAKAEHPEKMQQVMKLLEKVKEERELSTSLTEVLHAPSIISTTKALTLPTPTLEEAVGSERFEHADIQANLIVKHRELKVGEPLGMEIELVNAGKGPALLIKVNEAIPEGFELVEKQDIYRVEDSYINLRGKRLDPLKTEDVRLVLKPKVQGTFALKPTVLYIDENGKYKSNELESVTIMVKELGIRGWLKGEG